MRILMVSQMLPFLPCHDGFRIIPANLIRQLNAGHELHLIGVASGSETVEQRAWSERLCRSVLVTEPRLQRSMLGRMSGLSGAKPADLRENVLSRLEALEPDVLHLEGPSLAPLARLADSSVLTLLSAHDSLSLRFEQFSRFATSLGAQVRYRLRSLSARHFERKWYGQVDRVVVTSSNDAKALERSVDTKRLYAIPNGVDLDYWSYRRAPEGRELVFTGNMSWPPNVDAAERLAREILPLVRRELPETKLVIVGASPTSRVLALAELPGVKVTGTVPDLRPYVWRASAYVSPLRFGAGVKNKILEAMALGTPIVGTRQSLTGTPLVHGKEVWIGDDAPTMAAGILEIMKNERLAETLSRASRRRVESEYNWARVASQFEALYEGRNGD